MPSRANKNAAPSLPPQLEAVNLNAAGIDVGATEHWVAVPPDRDKKSVRSFPAFTADLERLADWLVACGITTVVMESTGNYWITLFEILEKRGLEVLLVDARRLRKVPGRKSDVQDCQWLQQLHTYGLLSNAFRPEEQTVILRSYVRQRAKHVRAGARHIQDVQNALTQMNIKLQHVVSDITGVTGMSIIRAILAGERDPNTLAKLRDYRCRSDTATIAASLYGHWRDDYLFQLKQAVQLLDVFRQRVAECDEAIAEALKGYDSKADPSDLPPAKKTRKKDRKSMPGDIRAEVFRVLGVDPISIDGIDESTALTLLAEIGTDMSAWPTSKQFASWLCLSPANDISGGKILKRGTRPNANRAANALRLAAASVHHSHSAIGAFYRRKRSQMGAPKAITATAHKIARTYYYTLKYRRDYVDPGEDFYERRHRARQVESCKRTAQRLGLRIVEPPKDAHKAPMPPVPVPFRGSVP